MKMFRHFPKRKKKFLLLNRAPLQKLQAAKNTAGVADAVVNFMTLKMKVEFAEGAEPQLVMAEVLKACRKVEPECEIYY